MSYYYNNEELLLSGIDILLKDSFYISVNVKHIPLTSYPSYIKFGLIGLCTRGNICVSVYPYEHVVEEDSLLILLPGELVALKSVSPDFSMNVMLLSSDFLNDIYSGICTISPYFFIYMRSHFWNELSDNQLLDFENYFSLLKGQMESENPYKKDSLIHLLRFFYLGLYNHYRMTLSGMKNIYEYNRKEKLAYDFSLLVVEYYRTEREVAFYAGKLCITSKYLSMVIKEVSGKAPKEWITEYIILEIKALLRSSNLNIQEIALRTNFSNQSSLARFFKKHTGMSPLQYRVGK